MYKTPYGWPQTLTLSHPPRPAPEICSGLSDSVSFAFKATRTRNVFFSCFQAEASC